MCIKLLLSFYHIACKSDVINGSVRYFFWAIGVMKKLLRAQWTEKVWAPLVSSMAMVTTQWMLALLWGQYIERLICVLHCLYFFSFCLICSSNDVSQYLMIYYYREAAWQSKCSYTEQFSGWLWRSTLIMPVFEREKRDLCFVGTTQEEGYCNQRTEMTICGSLEL